MSPEISGCITSKDDSKLAISLRNILLNSALSSHCTSRKIRLLMVCCSLRAIPLVTQHGRLLRRFDSDSNQLVVVDNNRFLFLRIRTMCFYTI